jgi:polyisoprenoid-binding protein YceI
MLADSREVHECRPAQGRHGRPVSGRPTTASHVSSSPGVNPPQNRRKEIPVSAIRTLAGIELPTPGIWEIDPGHTEVAFIGRHFMLTKVRGRFTGVTGTVTVAEEPVESSLDVTIDMASVSSGDQARDDHLRSADFFDVDNHPTARFRSTAITRTGDTTGTITGDLTIKGVSRPVTLAAKYVGHATDPWGNDRAVFSAHGTLNREDWGLTWNMLLDSGGLMVSKEIRIEVEVEAIRQTSG